MTFKARIRAFLAILLLGATSCFAMENLRLVIADSAGGPLDIAGRELGRALASSGAVASVRYENLPGASGAIGLARFVNESKGDPAALLLADSAMVASLARNRSGVTLAQTTPVARLTQQPAGDGWQGVFAAPAITNAQRDELARAIERAARSAQWRAFVQARKWQEGWLAGEAFAAFVDTEARRAGATR
jgi:tripartite-type tricarboxylate transporter receptor subunit TctC